MISTSLIVVSIIILGVWLLIELKRARHKIFAIFLIVLILFTYVSFSVVIKNKDIDLKTIDGLTKATKVYVVWLGSIFQNMKTITAEAVKMDWSGNQTLNSIQIPNSTNSTAK